MLSWGIVVFWIGSLTNITNAVPVDPCQKCQFPAYYNEIKITLCANSSAVSDFEDDEWKFFRSNALLATSGLFPWCPLTLSSTGAIIDVTKCPLQG